MVMSLGLSFAVLAAQAQPAAADATHVSVTFTLHNVPGHHEGTWNGQGGVTDAGIWSATGPCPGRGAPVFTCQFNPLTLVGQSGTITMQGESQFTVTSDPNIYDERGTWHITSGTGLYTGIGGEGTTSATLDFTAPQTTLLLQGNVTQ
jgi:hypothetical protein